MQACRKDTEVSAAENGDQLSETDYGQPSSLGGRRVRRPTGGETMNDHLKSFDVQATDSAVAHICRVRKGLVRINRYG
jgi:hypothetical protein